MEILIFSVFVLGYILITLEHSIKIDKLIPALAMMALAWTGIALGMDDFKFWFDSHLGQIIPLPEGHEERQHLLEGTLLHHFGKTAEILIFLIGAMTIVEITDHFNGFQTIKSWIRSKKKVVLLWVISVLAFVLSSIIDNLTATIVLITILRKLVSDTNLRMWFAGVIIIAANAGGAWSPIGDVTTTMLWMNNKVTAEALISHLFVASVICFAVPTIIASLLPVFKGEIDAPDNNETTDFNSKFMLFLGLTMIIFVPVFKILTHLPPYVGMMLSLAVVGLSAEILSKRKISLSEKDESGHAHGPTLHALSKIEMPSILFFLGILMTVAALESLGMIFNFGQSVLDSGVNTNVFITMLGFGSAVIDNVPLVAASMGMFPMAEYPIDHQIWHYIAYAAGTGGSILIIGSAAGVVAMGMEKISFFWYLKRISGLALAGYLAGAAFYLFV